MKTNRPPILLSGLILGLFGLGNLTAAYHDFFYHFFNLLALLLWIYFTILLLVHFNSYRQDFSKAPLLSSFATYPMASILLAAYVAKLGPETLLLARFIWYLALLLHLFLIVYFSWRFVIQSRGALTPSWTILYVGIAMAGLTHSVAGQPLLGSLSLLFGLLASLILYPLLYQQARKGELPDLLKPQWAIYCAPFSLLLGSYVRLSGPESDTGLLLILLGLSQAFYLLVLVLLPRIVSRGFFPSWAALTFPLVNTAFALQLSLSVLDLAGLAWLAHVEAVLAGLLVLLVFLHYSRILLDRGPEEQKNPT